MNCPLCGEICRCLAPVDAEAVPHRISGAAADPLSALAETQEEETSLSAPNEISQEDHSAQDGSEWRNEVAARVNRYRSRRKPTPPRYPSLRLPFDASPRPTYPDPPASPNSTFETASHHALALDGFIECSPGSESRSQAPPRELPPENQTAAAGGTHSGARLIEFPRFASTAPPPALDELAEPIIERPRILEAPE